jgi:hypothetical protein
MMNGESQPSDVGSGAEGLTGLLREAVNQIRAVPRPQELAGNIFERVAHWEPQENDAPAMHARRAAPVSRARKWTVATARAVAVVVLVAGAVALWLNSPTSHDPEPRVVRPNDPDQSSPADKAKESWPADKAKQKQSAAHAR